jgi:hypothetical protein
MSAPSFLEGVGVAVVASLAGSIGYWAFSAVLGGGLRLVIAGLSLGYLLYLLARSRERVGRLTTLAAWSLTALALWWLQSPLSLYVLGHLGALWLVRSLYFHSGPLAALADLGLNAFALAAALWALGHTGSLLLALWCFFLVQALFVAIPARPPRECGDGAAEPDLEAHFQQAQRTAEAALRRLSSVP